MAKKKRTPTPLSTITRDVIALSAPVGNIYETVAIISKRANQISHEIKQDLDKRLQDFSHLSDNLEEIHENREQIELSRYYEKLPKATLKAIKEFEDGKVYYRNPLQTNVAVE